MPIAFNQVPNTVRVPLFYAEFDSSQAALGQTIERSLIVGQMTSAGTATAGTPMLVTSLESARGLFGEGSMAARMVERYLANDGFPELWVLPLADAGGAVSATGTVTFVGTATANGTVSLYIGGRRVQATVATSDSVTTAAAALSNAVNAQVDLPVTASAAVGVVTLSARNGGTVGNGIDLRLNYRGALGNEASPEGFTITLDPMSGGAADPDLTTGLAVLGDEEYDYIVSPYTDSAALDAFDTLLDHVTGRWAPDRLLFGHVFAARAGTLSALSTFGNARNGPHVSVAGINGSPTPVEEIAAAVAGQAAGSLKAQPARPLQTLALTGVLAPAQADRFERDEREILLYDGVATLRVGPGDVVQIERLITTYQSNAQGDPDASWLDVQTSALNKVVVRRLRNLVTTRFGRCALADDGTPLPEGSGMCTPGMVKAAMIAEYGEMEALGWVENSAAFANAIIVERNITDPNRVDVLFPPDLVNQLRVLAVNVRFFQQYPATAA